jgi:hypothetical protein
MFFILEAKIKAFFGNILFTKSPFQITCFWGKNQLKKEVVKSGIN